MNSFLKSMLALSVLSVIEVSTVSAATAYRIVDKGAVGELENTFSQQKNSIGESVIAGTNLYNFPVQYQYLDSDDYVSIYNLSITSHERTKGLEPLEDYNSLLNGNPTANDLAWTLLFLETRRNDYEYQKIGNVYALINYGNESEILSVFDQNFESSNALTRSTDDYVNGITEDGWVYGNASAPYVPEEFTESNGRKTVWWTREFTTRGFFSPDRGKTIVSLLPPEDTYGGESAILDISTSRIAVGYASTGIDEDAKNYIEDVCKDDDVLDDIPLQGCIQQVSAGMYNTEAFKWYIDENGAVATEALGHLVTPHEYDERELVSVAQAVNSHGVAAGYSTGWINGQEFNPSRNEQSSLYAVIFKNGEVIDLTQDHREYFNSRAYDINDNGIVTGHAHTYVNGTLRSKFYYLDTNADEMIMKFPRGFFTSSASTARAINERGLIVGEGEFESHSDSGGNPRRKHAFIYDIDVDSFVDINDLLRCDSNYTVVEARDINEENEISGSAVLRIERLDSKGEPMLDDDGNQIYEDVVRAVDMIPYDDEVSDCTETQDKVDRQGASIGLFSLFTCVVLGFMRRRIFH